jgi:large subunit ribosomal protein L13
MKKTGQKTTIPTKETAPRDWLLVDAQNQVVGRLASAIADLLRGKHKPSFSPDVDAGDFVVVINASKVRFTGKKWDEKYYHHHSGYPGGMKSIKAKVQLEKHPERILSEAVWGMLPKNTLSRHQMTKLKIFSDSLHSHEAQKPTPVNIESML